jgi:Spy/CpxP family protein refolding chaperone
MKKTIAILSALFLLTQGTAMAARVGGDHINRVIMGHENRYNCSSLAANTKMKLTADQVVQLHALDEKYGQEIDPIREKLYGKGRELKAEWLQTEPNQDKIEAIHRDVTNLREQMRATLAAHRSDVLKILTLEQRAQVPDEGLGHVFTKPTGFGRHQDRR